jgi:hypothetical protein
MLSRFLAVFLLVLGCSSSSPPPAPAPDGAIADAAVDAPPSVDSGNDGGRIGLAGTVKDKAGVPVSNAKLEVGAIATFSDVQGRYTLAGLPAGAATLKVTRDWFKPLETSITVAASGVTAYDVSIEEIPLKLDPADRALATGYATTFDWSKQTVSISVAAKPTRRDFDNAVYFHNPALYRSTAGEPPLTPSPALQIAGGVATGFTFPIRSGPHMGQEAFDALVVDSISETPFGPDEPAVYALWTPLVNWLSEWDAAKTAELRAVGVAVRQQTWGGNSLRPQEVEKVYLDGVRGAIWVKVVFASFVQLGPGITDNDGDGLKEVYAKVGATHYNAEIIDRLTMYGATLLDTHGLSKEVSKSLNELYSTTAAQVESFIGTPFEVPGVGTIKYPFVVLRHARGEKNVILVPPAP